MFVRPLFVTRKFRDSAGGMETLAAEVWRGLAERRPDAKLIALSHRNGHLAWWLPLAVVRTGFVLLRGRADTVISGDAVVFSALQPIMGLTRAHQVVMVHGLDLTWDKRPYQWWMRRAIRRADALIAVSEPTACIARAIGVRDDRITVVRPGVTAPPVSRHDRAQARRALAAKVGASEKNRFILTLGRVVPRKGVSWFTESVLPYLPDDVLYVVAGDGPDVDAVRAAAERAGVVHRLRMLGWVSDSEREQLLRGADLFVQPNIPVPGDVEGFGIVVIEAALRGTPVIGSRLEGITDAIADGESGLLCPPGDAPAWISTVNKCLADLDALVERGQQFRVHAEGIYGRDRMTRELAAVLEPEYRAGTVAAGAAR
jgi:glycosyltransferase involved in cell wall biosynthesis